MWICLYMCCITRAVHIDEVPDMSAVVVEIEAIINARTLSLLCLNRGHRRATDTLTSAVWMLTTEPT